MASPFVLSALVRRWYVLVALLVVIGFAVAPAYRDSEARWSVTGSLVVVESASLSATQLPESLTGGRVTNPFFGNGGTAIMAALLEDSLNNGRVQVQYLSVGQGLAALQNEDTRAVVDFTAVAQTAAGAQEAAQATFDGASDVLAAIQTDAGSPPTELYQTVPGGAPTSPVVSYPDRLRAVVALALGGVLGAVVVTLVVDRMIGFVTTMRRSERRSRRSSEGADHDFFDEGAVADEGSSRAPVSSSTGGRSAH